MKFAIISYILHNEHNNAYYSYEPYVREMNIWLNSAKEIIVVAPKITSPPNGIETAYLHNKISFRKIPAITFLNFYEVIRSLVMLPRIIYKIMMAMKEADHIHLRCPGNIGLLGCLVQLFFPQTPKTAKYAGNWDPKAKQPWSYKLQKWILSNTFLTRNMNVLVYGKWSNQTKNILPFFTASFNESEIEVVIKNFNPPYKFLFVGGLVAGKQPLFAMQLVAALNKRSIPVELHIYGDGPLKNDLQKEGENKDYIHLHGNKTLEVLKQAYKDAHFLTLASKSEGWPKAIAEAMFFGCIPIATVVSCVPWMLGGGSRGILMSEGNVWNENLEDRGQWMEDRGKKENGERKEESQHVINKRDLVAGVGVDNREILNDTAERIIDLIKHPEKMRRMSMEAQEWSQEYTLERFEEEIKKLLVPQDARP